MNDLPPDPTNYTKEEIMAKLETPTPPAAVYTESAFGMIQDPKTSEWTVVEIRYNNDFQVNPVVIKHTTTGYRDYAIEKFKILVGESNILGD